MKFADGFWLKRKGVNIFSPAEVRDYNIKGTELTLYTPITKIVNRGQTLGGPLLTINVSSPIENVIRIRAYHFKGGIKLNPSFELTEASNSNVNIIDDSYEIIYQSGVLTARICKSDYRLSFYYQDRPLTTSGGGQMGYVTTATSEIYMREQFDLGIGECVYGLGEHFTALTKNGQVVDCWNEDGGTSSEQSYKNIPFYITNKGYGVFVNHPERVSFEVASEAVSRVQFSVPGEYIDYFIIGGDDLKEVLKNYTSLTGKPGLPPAWSFGLWLTTSFTTSYDEQTVTSFIDGMLNRDIPMRVFHFDCFWMKEFEWCNFKWDDTVFPDPENMLKRIKKKKGIKICAWINPYISQKSELFDEAMEKGFLIRKINGDVWQWDLWQPGMAIVDFTNSEACKWFCSKLERLIDIGVDCFKTDFGERIPIDVMYSDGSDPIKMHNYYTYLYNKTVYDLLVSKLGKKEAMLFARSATVGTQKFPVHWGGDCVSKYESMAESLRGGLSLCMSGFGFWSHDISGFENTATPDLYKRWVAFGLLSTHSRLHGSSSYRVPWLFDDEAVDVVRYFSKLKCSLMPYLYTQACYTSNTGIPTMRAMALEFFKERACDYLETQYMLGESLLVAPIFKEDGNVEYYLPKGVWTNLLNNQRVIGGGWQSENHGYMSIPLMVRPNSIIAIGYNCNIPDYDYTNKVTFNIFELEEGCTAQADIYNIDGKKSAAVQAERIDNKISISVEGAIDYSIVMRNIKKIANLSGAAQKDTALGIQLMPSTNENTIEFSL